MMSEFIWEYEADREAKRAAMIAEIKDQKRKEKKEKKRKRRKKRIRTMIITVVILIVLVVFVSVPIVKIDSIEVRGNTNVTNDFIIKKLNIRSRESISSLLLKQYRVKYKDSSLDGAHLSYNFRDKIIYANVKEVKPLSHTASGGTYVNSNGTVKVTDDLFSSPILEGLSEDAVDEINTQLGKVPYKVILEMKSIKMSDKEKNILLIQMYDGNKIYIYPDQIGQKMKYYLEMKNILNENKKGPGNIYLYMGDYYEEETDSSSD